MTEETYRVRGIPDSMIDRLWPFAEPYIKRALDHAAGEITPEDLKANCLSRDVQLWLVSQGSRIVGAATTEIIIYPHRKHCRVITLAGSDFMSWVQHMDDTLEQWATSLGCDAMEAHVRRGFVQKLAPLGYKHLHSVIFKNLSIMAVSQPIPAQGEQIGEKRGRR